MDSRVVVEGDQQIPVVDVSSISLFFHHFKDQPVIIKGLSVPELDFLNIQAVSGPKIWAINCKTEEHEEVEFATILELWQKDSREYNVVDHSFQKNLPDVDKLFPIPSFWQEIDWLRRIPEVETYERSVVLTSKGSFTGIHVDSYGFPGWMFLFSGVKEWTIIHPKYSSRLFNPTTKRFEKDPRAFPDRPPAYFGTQHAGELLYFPPGFLHAVYTPERSAGYGGTFLNRYTVEDSVKVWIWERSLGIQGKVDLAAVIKQIISKDDHPSFLKALEMIQDQLKLESTESMQN